MGEIWDEHDEKLTMMTQVNETNYQFHADFSLVEFCNIMEVPVPESTYHSLGGWVVEKFERIPIVGETFIYNETEIGVEHMDGKRVRRLLVKKNLV